VGGETAGRLNGIGILPGRQGHEGQAVVERRRRRTKSCREGIMPDFVIQSPHTKEECLRALDETLALGQDTLGKFEYGCGTGDHTAYGIVQASDIEAATRLVPEFLRDKATISEVDHVSADQIRQYHQAA
jgi:hypothetical protein